MPTLRQLQARHPDAVMKWFARGRLWETQDQERADALARRRPRTGAAVDRRPRDWRPGGEHQDPRDRFKVPRDEKRRRFAQNLRRDRNESPAGDRTREPNEDRPRPPARAPRLERPQRFGRPARPDSRAKPPWNREPNRDGKPGGWKHGADRTEERRRSGNDLRPHGSGKPDSRRPHGAGRGQRPAGGRKPPGGGNRGGSGGR